MEFDGIKALGVPGWVEVGLRGGGDQAPRLLVKFEERDGRAVITRLVLVGDVLNSATLRALPIGRAEAVLNSGPGLPEGIMKSLDPEVLSDMAERGHLFPAEIGALDSGIDGYVDKEPAALSAVKVTRSRKPLTRPDGTDPEGFSRRVAEAYNEVIQQTSAPAPVLAAEAGVPVVTVHRWIAEARRRGFLPPARKGRAG